MSHVAQEQNQEHELVPALLLTVQKKLNKHLVTQVQLAPSIVIPIVILGAHGLLALSHVMAVYRQENASVHCPLRVCVSHRKIKTAERITVHQIHVPPVLVRTVNGPNGVSALKHAVVEFKTDFDCCVVQIVTPKNK